MESCFHDLRSLNFAIRFGERFLAPELGQKKEQNRAVKLALTKVRNTDLGLRRHPAAMRDLSTIAFFRTGVLLRRSGPVPGILAAHRSGAIMDKSGRPRVATSTRQLDSKP